MQSDQWHVLKHHILGDRVLEILELRPDNPVTSHHLTLPSPIFLKAYKDPTAADTE